MALSALEAKLLAGDVSKQTHDSIVAQIEAPAKNDAPEAQDKKAPQSEAGRTAGREHDRGPAAGFAGVSEEIAVRSSASMLRQLAAAERAEKLKLRR